MRSNNGFDLKEPVTFNTELEIDGKTVNVEWKESEDILIPENKKFYDRWIVNVEPPVNIDNETLLRMCEEVESARS